MLGPTSWVCSFNRTKRGIARYGRIYNRLRPFVELVWMRHWNTMTVRVQPMPSFAHLHHHVASQALPFATFRTSTPLCSLFIILSQLLSLGHLPTIPYVVASFVYHKTLDFIGLTWFNDKKEICDRHVMSMLIVPFFFSSLWKIIFMINLWEIYSWIYFKWWV